jgi:hypothetical protein
MGLFYLSFIGMKISGGNFLSMEKCENSLWEIWCQKSFKKPFRKSTAQLVG